MEKRWRVVDYHIVDENGVHDVNSVSANRKLIERTPQAIEEAKHQQALIDELVGLVKAIDRDGKRTGKYCTCLVCLGSVEETLAKAEKEATNG